MVITGNKKNGWLMNVGKKKRKKCVKKGCVAGKRKGDN